MDGLTGRGGPPVLTRVLSRLWRAIERVTIPASPTMAVIVLGMRRRQNTAEG